jgi:hypothetical protein
MGISITPLQRSILIKRAGLDSGRSGRRAKVILAAAQGATLGKIHRDTGVPKSTARLIIKDVLLLQKTGTHDVNTWLEYKAKAGAPAKINAAQKSLLANSLDERPNRKLAIQMRLSTSTIKRYRGSKFGRQNDRALWWNCIMLRALLDLIPATADCWMEADNSPSWHSFVDGLTSRELSPIGRALARLRGVHGYSTYQLKKLLAGPPEGNKARSLIFDFGEALWHSGVKWASGILALVAAHERGRYCDALEIVGRTFPQLKHQDDDSRVALMWSTLLSPLEQSPIGRIEGQLATLRDDSDHTRSTSALSERYVILLQLIGRSTQDPGPLEPVQYRVSPELNRQLRKMWKEYLAGVARQSDFPFLLAQYIDGVGHDRSPDARIARFYEAILLDLISESMRAELERGGRRETRAH